MSTRKFVVTGATGNVGGKLTEQLLARGHSVRAIARNGQRLQPLASKGAEILEGSVLDVPFLTRTLKGADGVFALVPPDYGSDRLLEHQRAVVDAEVAAIKAAGVPRVVALSSVGAHHPSRTGPIVSLHYLEQQLGTLDGVDVLWLRAAYFMENLLGDIDTIKTMGILGTPVKPDVAFAMVATKDVADAAAARLAKADFSGKSVRYVLGPRDVTYPEVARILGEAIGKPDLPYVQFSDEDTRKALIAAGLPQSVAEAFVEMQQAVNEGLLEPTERRSSQSTTPTTLEEWSKTFAVAYKGASRAASA